MNETLKLKLRHLPTCPGCYIMKSQGQIIYVGKAVNLKNRVRQYFRQSKSHTIKVRTMVSRIDDFDVILCDSNLEALTLECNLIKAHRPQYNILLKDDKHYPYLRINTRDSFPRVEIVRSVHKDGAVYFGPYMGTTEIHDVLATLQELFPLRTCEGAIDPLKKRRPCLHYQLGECPAPCAGFISQEDYGSIVHEVIGFLAGKSAAILDRLQSSMADAAANMRYEEAALLRDRLKSAQLFFQNQKAISVKEEERDVIAVATDGIDAMVQVLFVRGGRMLGSGSYALEGAGDQPPEEILASFLTQYYDDGKAPPAEILCQYEPDQIGDLATMLAQRRGSRIHVCTPQKGVKHHLIAMASKNASDALEKRNAALARKEERTTGACEALAREIGLPCTPRRIEGYDISNTQGILSVASMVVAIDGIQAPKEYRRFRIKTVEGANDFASMNEILTRRLLRARQEREAMQKNGSWPDDERKLSGFADLPDLIIIDGGPQQLSFARSAMLSVGFDIPILGLAKRLEEVFLPDQEESILLPRKSPALHLIQRVRDEAHRFCITYHRNLRQNAGMRSVLDEIPGIGPVKRKALLKSFKTIRAIREASPEALCQVPGIGPEQANTILQFFSADANN